MKAIHPRDIINAYATTQRQPIQGQFHDDGNGCCGLSALILANDIHDSGWLRRLCHLGLNVSRQDMADALGLDKEYVGGFVLGWDFDLGNAATHFFPPPDSSPLFIAGYEDGRDAFDTVIEASKGR